MCAPPQWSNKHIFTWLIEETFSLCKQNNGLNLPIITNPYTRTTLYHIHLSIIQIKPDDHKNWGNHTLQHFDILINLDFRIKVEILIYDGSLNDNSLLWMIAGTYIKF